MKSLSIISRIWREMSAGHNEIVFVLCLMPFNIALQALTPWFTKMIIDSVSLSASMYQPAAMSFASLLLPSALYTVVIATLSLLSYLQLMALSRTSQACLSGIRKKLFRHIATLPMSTIDAISVGDLTARVIGDIEGVGAVFFGGPLHLLSDILSATVALVLVFYLAHSILFPLALCGIVFLISGLWFDKMLKQFHRLLRIGTSSLQSYLANVLVGMNEIQAFQTEDSTAQIFGDQTSSIQSSQLSLSKYEAAVLGSFELVNAFALAIVLWFGGKSVFQRVITLGTLVAILQYIQMFFAPLRQSSITLSSTRAALVSAERVFEVLDMKSEPTGKDQVEAKDQEDSLPLEKIEPAGRNLPSTFESVSFSYKPGKLILKELSFAQARGERIAIVGPTGSGKSTIFKLLTKLYFANEGTLRVDGIDVLDWTTADLRSHVGLLPQNTQVFSGTLVENVALGCSSADNAEIHRLLNFLRDLHIGDGLFENPERPLVERGANLSNGERQALALARILLKRPNFILLDESMSALDGETEGRLVHAIGKICGDGTPLLVVTHRLSSARDCDRILVVAAGRLVESGTHDQLIEARELYYQWWKIQSEGHSGEVL